MHISQLMVIGVSAVGCALALAACGSSAGYNPAAATNPNSSTGPLALSQCMHSHGIKNFPDPTFLGTGQTSRRQGRRRTPAARRCRTRHRRLSSRRSSDAAVAAARPICRFPDERTDEHDESTLAGAPAGRAGPDHRGSGRGRRRRELRLVVSERVGQYRQHGDRGHDRAATESHRDRHRVRNAQLQPPADGLQPADGDDHLASAGRAGDQGRGHAVQGRRRPGAA